MHGVLNYIFGVFKSSLDTVMFGFSFICLILLLYPSVEHCCFQLSYLPLKRQDFFLHSWWKLGKVLSHGTGRLESTNV